MSSSASETPNESPNVTESQRQRILSSERRRALLDVLAEQSTPLDVNSLAKAIASLERNGSHRDSDEITRIATMLHHCHLPKLDEVGVVEYDWMANRVTAFHDRIPR